MGLMECEKEPPSNCYGALIRLPFQVPLGLLSTRRIEKMQEKTRLTERFEKSSEDIGRYVCADPQKYRRERLAGSPPCFAVAGFLATSAKHCRGCRGRCCGPAI